MVWVTRRQHRTQVLVAAAFLLVAGVPLLAHGIQTDVPFSARGGPELLGARLGQVSRLLAWSVAVPVLVGLFWGARRCWRRRTSAARTCWPGPSRCRRTLLAFPN